MNTSKAIVRLTSLFALLALIAKPGEHAEDTLNRELDDCTCEQLNLLADMLARVHNHIEQYHAVRHAERNASMN